MLSLFEAALAGTLFGCSAALGFSRVSNRGALLTALSALSVALAAASYLQGRTVVLPTLALASLWLLLSLPSTIRNATPAKRPATAVVALIVAMLCMLPIWVLKPTIKFPEPEGTHSVGVRDAEVQDGTRGMAWDTEADGPRRFLIRIWYPAKPQDTRPRHRNSAAEIHAARNLGPASILGESLTRTTTHAARDAQPEPGAYPLLIFSHGYAGPIYANSALMEQLASHGYVAVSITHPLESSALVYPDGEFLPQDAEVASLFEEHGQTKLFNAFTLSAFERYDWAIDRFEPIRMVSERLPLWAQDFSSVLTALQAATSDPALAELVSNMDFNRVGFLGMSAGGGSAAEACHLDRRCQAVAALDGGIGTPALRNRLIRVPALILDGGYPSRLAAQDLYFEPHDSFGQASDIYRIVFPNNGHSDFTDNALVLSTLGKVLVPIALPVLGPVDGEQSILAQAQLTTSFFDVYLKGRSHEALQQTVRTVAPVARFADPEPLRGWASARGD